MISHCYTKKTLRNSGVYMLICKQSGKFYIGSSVDMDGRSRGHKSDFINNKHGNNYMQNIVNKYKLGFVFVILEICERAQVRIREQDWIDKMNPVLNLMKVVDGRIGHTPETRAKLSKARKGVPISAEHKVKVIENWKYIDRTGKPYTEEEKTKMRQSMPQSKWIKVNGVRYDSVKHASQNLPISRQSLSAIINGQTTVLKHKDIYEVETVNFKITK